MPGIGVINNPHSRRNRKNPEWLRSLGYIVGTRGTSVSTRHVDDVHAMMRLFCEQQIDILAINGGDGSNSVALTALIRAYGERPLPKIAMLRGGTMNVVANSCGVKGTPSGLMVNLVHKYREGEPFETTWRDTLKVEQRYGFIFGVGLIHSFLEALYARGQKSVWGTTRLLGRGMLSAVTGGPFAKRLFQPVRARVTVDGRELPQRSFAAVGAATVAQIGLRFKPFFRWDERMHSFHLLGVLGSPARFVFAMPRIYLGKPVSEKKLFETVATDAVLEAQAPLGYTLDGENHTAGHRLVVSTGPRLEIIVR